MDIGSDFLVWKADKTKYSTIEPAWNGKDHPKKQPLLEPTIYLLLSHEVVSSPILIASLPK
ncbi:MAG TPA: hypothetical protein VG097_12490 [Gemmata sp.]|nr:hypothetical protein [Gemmata sp.]